MHKFITFKKHYWLTLAIALQQLQATIWLYSSIIQGYLFDVKVLERRSLNHTRHGVTFTAPKLGKIYLTVHNTLQGPRLQRDEAARRRSVNCACGDTCGRMSMASSAEKLRNFIAILALNKTQSYKTTNSLSFYSVKRFNSYKVVEYYLLGY